MATESLSSTQELHQEGRNGPQGPQFYQPEVGSKRSVLSPPAGSASPVPEAQMVQGTIRVHIRLSENPQGHYDCETQYIDVTSEQVIGQTTTKLDKKEHDLRTLSQICDEVVLNRQENYRKVSIKNELIPAEKEIATHADADPFGDQVYPKARKLQAITSELLHDLDAYYLGKRDALVIEEIGSGEESIVYKCIKLDTQEVFVIKRPNIHGAQMGGLETTLLARYTTISGVALNLCEYVQGTRIGEPIFFSERCAKRIPLILEIPYTILNAASGVFSSLVFNVTGRWEYVRGTSADTIDCSAHFLLEESPRPYGTRILKNTGVPFICLRASEERGVGMCVRWFRARQIDS